MSAKLPTSQASLCLIFIRNPLLEVDKYLNASSGYFNPLKPESHCKLPALMANLQIVPASKNVEAQHVEMMVPLYSYGCEKKVKKALSHLRGTQSIQIPRIPIENSLPL